MDVPVTLDAIYKVSEDVVARDIKGQLMIVPLTTGIGDSDEELFGLNKTGRAIWERLDGQRSLREVVRDLSARFDAPDGAIEAGVLGLAKELVRRKIIIAVVAR